MSETARNWNQNQSKLNRKMSKSFIRVEVTTQRKKNSSDELSLNVLYHSIIQSHSICSSGSIHYRLFPSSCLFSDVYTIWSCVLVLANGYASIAEETERREHPIIYTPRRTNWIKQYIQHQFIRANFCLCGEWLLQLEWNTLVGSWYKNSMISCLRKEQA